MKKEEFLARKKAIKDQELLMFRKELSSDNLFTDVNKLYNDRYNRAGGEILPPNDSLWAIVIVCKLTKKYISIVRDELSKSNALRIRKAIERKSVKGRYVYLLETMDFIGNAIPRKVSYTNLHKYS